MASEIGPFPLLRTKLYRPRATGDLIHRPRACEMLDRHFERAMTLVCAPAGFGKTTLLNDWLDHRPYLSAWLSLDERDGDVRVFLSYVIAAVRTLFPDACTDTLTLLRAHVLPPLDSLVTELANDLDRLADDPTAPPATSLPAGQRFILVLDDYHLIHEKAIHSLLGELLRHPPRTLHLVISTRMDPPFPLLVGRARGELGELRVRDLRFTLSEVSDLMQQALDAPLGAQELATLAERTEGWGTGLRLAALTLNAGGNLTAPELAVDNRYVLDYLMNEVFARVPLATQDFLLRTAILDRLCGALCDAVVGPVDSAWGGDEYLEWLAAQNLFTFSLDAHGTWYRYHRIFRTLLRNRLERQQSALEIAQLHGRASAWFAENGLIEEAIEHAVATGDVMAIVRVTEGRRHEAMNRERWRELERWFSLIPRHMVDARPELLILEAWILHARFQLSDLRECLDRTEACMRRSALPSQDSERLQGEVDALRSQLLYWSADPSATLETSQKALSAVPPDRVYAYNAALTYFAGAIQMQGGAKPAVEAVLMVSEGARIYGAAAQARPLMILCALYWISADLSNLIPTATRLLQLSREAGLLDCLTRADFYLGCAHYLKNNLPASKKHFACVMEQRHSAYGLIAAQSGFGLAATYQAEGLTEQAREVLGVVVNDATNENNRSILRDAEAFGARLALLEGRTLEADRWAARTDLGIAAVPMPIFFVASFSLVQVLLTRGAPAGTEEAGRRLARLREVVETNHNTRFLIEALALEALLEDARGNRAESVAALRQAIALAEAGGVIRVFADLGPRMAGLFRQLPASSVPREFRDRLLAAFSHTREPRPAANQQNLVEPLSERELEVLVLLGERLSNKEIARKLTISPTTVKRHTVNIYGKLSVGSRRSAVERAAALGLLPAAPRGGE